MQNIGQSWLVLQLTGSPLKLGIVNALQWLPVMLLAFAAGPLIDRYPKRRILLVTQIVLMALALVLAALVGSGLARYWHVLVLALLLGCVNTVDNPTRQAFVIELAGRDDLMNAISLNSTVFNLARILHRPDQRHPPAPFQRRHARPGDERVQPVLRGGHARRQPVRGFPGQRRRGGGGPGGERGHRDAGHGGVRVRVDPEEKHSTLRLTV
jgi:hypothetical protein